ncbi:MAG: glycoside hydrolase family 2 protein [Armatimonadota bacterium]|nr:glycoside hydrolase family 2 protein [Armatimonadota bacterium]
MAKRINLNRGWDFIPEDVQGAQNAPKDSEHWNRINLPHTNKLLPHHAFDDREYQFVSWYRKRVTLPTLQEGGRVFLDFDGVMIACEVFVNGEKVGEHRGGYTPFSVDLTGKVHGGSEALVAVRVDSTERPDIPPFGFVVDYLTFGGIYRDVWLRTCGPTYIKDVFLRSLDVLQTPGLRAEIELDGVPDGHEITLRIHEITLRMKDGEGAEIASTTVPVGGSHTQASLTDLSGIELWSIQSPVLYRVEVELKGPGGEIVDTYDVRHGFREARFCEDGAFRLNGQVVKLIGLDRHQTYPYIGQAAPPRLQRRDADILKYELALNIVRTSHYPQSPHFLDRCDEIGLLVFEEIPGWQHIGNEEWQGLAQADVRDMILRDRNHPSIILWGVRINESPDSHDFYTATNRIAHELDDTRQTGGVRNFKPSEFLEDVFTYNDFSNGVQEPDYLPYLITEFNGHMFPTKTWDNEERKVEHALRHARIQSLQMANPRVAGALGWCAFDYNTHALFGSGDRICYHGVSDIFRLPKWAAYVYASQADPELKVVLEIASYWTMGDRSEGGVEPLLVLSNCDSIKVFVGGQLRGEHFPAKEEYPGLPHPPFIVRNLGGLWGGDWQDIVIEGFVAGQKAAEARKSSDRLPAAIRAWVDSDELVADGQDMTALNFQVADKFGNVVAFTSEIISLSIEGPVELIGPNPFAPQGGQGAVYLKATDIPGEVTVTLSCARLTPVEIRLKVNSE